MADYNVQMKQYNGTSFDNILPYASQALTLAGVGGATEIIAQARAGLSQIATGSYVGTGTYGASHPTVITCGFKPKIVMFFSEVSTVSAFNKYPNNCYGVPFQGWTEAIQTAESNEGDYRVHYHFTTTETSLSYYITSRYDKNLDADHQNNSLGKSYYFVAIG